MYSYDRAGSAGVTIPADDGTHFDRDPRANVGRQDAVAVLLVLLLEQFSRRHADHAGAYALALELFVSRDAELHFAAGADQNDARLAHLGIGHHIGTLREPGCARI